MSRKVGFVGVPMDLGGARRGTNVGPTGVRHAGMAEAIESLGIEFTDTGNIEIADVIELKAKDSTAKYLQEISAACVALRDRVKTIFEKGEIPLSVGGDHSIAVGTVAGASDIYYSKGDSIGLLWFDAHGDMNTPDSTESGNVHGMPLAACLGLGRAELTKMGSRFPLVDPSNACVVGVRSLDHREKDLIKEIGLRVFTMREIDIRGMHDVMVEALEIVNSGTAGFHLSFDVDGADPSIAPGVGTPVPAGLGLRECHLFMEMVAETENMVSLDVTEINPLLDNHNETSKLAVELCQSAFGKLIL